MKCFTCNHHSEIADKSVALLIGDCTHMVVLTVSCDAGPRSVTHQRLYNKLKRQEYWLDGGERGEEETLFTLS